MATTILGVDIGATQTKFLEFQGDVYGHLWFTNGFPETIPQVPTPRDVPAREFMEKLAVALAEAGVSWDTNALIGYSICGPVVKNTCLRLINAGVFEPFIIDKGVLGNDGMMATIGSLVAGAARGHTGGVAGFTLGTGIGFGSLHWDHQGHRVTNDGEIHFTVRDSRTICQCHREGCFEAAANEDALYRYAIEAGWNPPSAQDLRRLDLGRLFERILDDPASPDHDAVHRAVHRWHGFLAQGLANVYSVLNLGGSIPQLPALFVLGGGLSALVDEKLLYNLILKQEFRGDPFIGANFLVKKEGKLGNRTGCVGAAAAALADDLDRSVITDIQLLESPPEDT